MLFGSIERKDVSIFCMFKEKGFVGIAWQWVRSKRKGDIETAYVSSRIAHIGITEEEAVIPSLFPHLHSNFPNPPSSTHFPIQKK